jgi:hypothetical protein
MTDTQPEAICESLKANGQPCKKHVARGETRCHWHAHGVKARIRSLEHNHRLGFWMTVAGLALGLGFGLPGVYWHYHANPTSPNNTVTSSGDNSPNVVDNHGSVTIQHQGAEPKKESDGGNK